MLCAHGIESHGMRFAALAARIPGLRIIAPDLRGHGRSPMTGPWGVDEHVADLAPLVADLTAPVLLGHSFGGLLAWELARRSPESISALVLVDPAIAVTAEVARVSQSHENSSLGHSWADPRDAYDHFAAGRPASGLWAAALDAALAVAPGDDKRLRPLLAPEAVAAAWAEMQRPLRESSWRGPTLLVEAGRGDGKIGAADVVGGGGGQLGAGLDHRV